MPGSAPQPVLATTPLLRWEAVVTMAQKEWLQLRRDRYLMGFLIVLPLAQLLVMGLAIQNDIKAVPTFIYNFDQRNPSWELVKAFQSNDTFKTVLEDKRIHDKAELVAAVRHGRYRLGIIIPPDYSRGVLKGQEAAPIQVIMDGTNANLSKSILQAVRGTVSQPFGPEASKQDVVIRLATPRLTGQGSVNNGSPDPLAPFISQGLSPATGLQALTNLEAHIINNPDLSSTLFLIPAILGIIMHMLTVMLASFSLVREREAGTLEPLLVTPLQPMELLLGKLLPYLTIGLLDMVLTLGLMSGFFQISIEHGLGFLALASTCFIVASLALGLLFSTWCRTQVQAVQLSFGLLLPCMLLSGFVFPIEPMPRFIQAISYALPLTYYLEIIRGVIIKGLGYEELWAPTIILAAFAVLFLAISLLRFRRAASFA